MIAEFARNVNANLFTLPFLFRMVNMKTLSLNLKVFHICCDEEQTLPIFDRELTQSELSRLRPAKFAARSVGDASKFQIVATDVEGYNATEEQRTMFDTNIRLLQDFVRAQMLSQKSNVTSVKNLGSESFTPIYTGSQVGLESSAMRGTPRRRDLFNGLSLLSRRFMASGQPPFIESIVVELLDISLHKGATTGIDVGDEGVAAQTVSPRAQAEKRVRVVERRLRKAQRASILLAFWFSVLLIWLGMELEFLNRLRERCAMQFRSFCGQTKTSWLLKGSSEGVRLAQVAMGSSIQT